MELIELLNELTSVNGVSGAEVEASKAAASLLRPYGDVSITNSSSVICKVGKHTGDKPSLLLDAHIDEIGMIVTYITDEGFINVAECGGIDARVLPASEVTILGKEKIKGVVTSVPPHLSDDSEAVPETAKTYIDTGFTKTELEKLVSIGDRVLIENAPVSLAGDRITGKALDDRCGCAAILRTLELLGDKPSAYDLTVMFSSAEEVGERGAKTGAFLGEYDEAIAVDVTFAVSHGESKSEYSQLGKGPAIGISPSLSQDMSDRLKKLAKDNDIPFQLEVMGGLTGTNADVIAVTKGGIKAVTLSIPERYMHTPVEAVSLSDIENTAKLIAAYISEGR